MASARRSSRLPLDLRTRCSLVSASSVKGWEIRRAAHLDGCQRVASGWGAEESMTSNVVAGRALDLSIFAPFRQGRVRTDVRTPTRCGNGHEPKSAADFSVEVAKD